MTRWKLSARPWLPLLAPLAFMAAACGGGAVDDATQERPTLPTAVTTAGAGERARLGVEALVAVRTLPSAALSAEALEPAGRAEAADGGTIDLARAASGRVLPWEYVSVADDGWRVWQPAALAEVLADAGPGATIADVSEADWPDSCLGLARQDEICLTVITPGYRVIVEQSGRRIEYHTARAGGFRSLP